MHELLHDKLSSGWGHCEDAYDKDCAVLSVTNRRCQASQSSLHPVAGQKLVSKVS